MVIFGCGVITGAMVVKSALPAHPPAAQQQELAPNLGLTTNFLRRVQKQLDLTPDESEAIGKIIKQSQERTRPIWEQIAPQMRDERKRVREEIRAVLTPEQQRRWDKLIKARPRKLPPGAPPPPDSPAPTNSP